MWLPHLWRTSLHAKFSQRCLSKHVFKVSTTWDCQYHKGLTNVWWRNWKNGIYTVHWVVFPIALCLHWHLSLSLLLLYKILSGKGCQEDMGLWFSCNWLLNIHGIMKRRTTLPPLRSTGMYISRVKNVQGLSTWHQNVPELISELKTQLTPQRIASVSSSAPFCTDQVLVLDRWLLPPVPLVAFPWAYCWVPWGNSKKHLYH